MPDTRIPAPCIGIFDSGVGGLSVLRAMRLALPGHRLHYVADSGHAPYGDRDVVHVIERSIRVSDHLVNHGAGMIVVACNTATAWAIDALRARHPALPLVGIEPGVKPAAAASRNRRIGVMATPATLSSERFDRLVRQHAQGCEVLRVPCAGLAAAIERGTAAEAELDRLLDQYCVPLHAACVDTVVLGCTHYPFVADRIAQRLDSDVLLLDTAQAVARQAHALSLRHLAAEPHNESTGGWVRLQSTGEGQTLEHLARSGLGLDQAAERIEL